MSDFACREMTERSTSLIQRLTRLLRRHHGSPIQDADTVTGAPDDGPPPTLLHPDPVPTGERFRWRKHPLLLKQPSGTTPDNPGERHRAAATRGLFLARSGRIEDAREAFCQAAHDPGIDLSALPGFWDLNRGGMLAAVDAYEATGRFRDAAALGARIRLRYRPRIVSDLPVARRSQVN